MLFYQVTNQSGIAFNILHFGIGLIGSAIKKELLGNHYFSNQNVKAIKFDWNNPENCKKQIARLLQVEAISFQQSQKIFIIWSAGKAGFSVNEDITNKELLTFKLITSFLSLQLNNLKVRSYFFFLSSAGGLFEGQKNVGQDSQPKPKRPYSVLKLNQENHLLKKHLFLSIEIIRLSTVFTIENFSKRKGLIQVLMENGIKNKITHIVGNESTIRDYICDKDIAHYIIRRILLGKIHQHISYLISGKPSSIFEIRRSIEKILGKRIYITYSTVKSNAEDISFFSHYQSYEFFNRGFKAISQVVIPKFE